MELKETATGIAIVGQAGNTLFEIADVETKGQVVTGFVTVYCPDAVAADGSAIVNRPERAWLGLCPLTNPAAVQGRIKEAVGPDDNLLNATWEAMRLATEHYQAPGLEALVWQPGDPMPEPPGWLLWPLVATGGYSVLYGEANAGKSQIAAAAALTAASGVSVAGIKPPPRGTCHVAILDFEGAPGAYANTLRRLSSGAGLEFDTLPIIVLSLAGRGGIKTLAQTLGGLLRDQVIDFAVVDSATSSSGDTMTPAEVTGTIDGIQSWGIPSLIIAHQPKNGTKTIYGAQAWTALARVATHVSLVDRTDKNLVVSLGNTKSNDLPPPVDQDVALNYHDGYTMARMERAKGDDSLTALISGELLGEPKTATEIADALGINRASVAHILNESPHFQKLPKEGRRQPYSLA